MHYFDEEKYVPLLADKPNIIKYANAHVLPKIEGDFAIVSIFLTTKQQVSVESRYHPIRYGRHCGSKVFLCATRDNIDYNPMFLWNGKEWLFQTHGNVLFAEIEVK